MRSAVLHALAVALSVCLVATAPAAVMTPVYAPPSDEDGHAKILSQVYHTTFLPTFVGSIDYTSGGLTATRVEDSYSLVDDGPVPPRPLSPLLASLGADDQVWNGNFKLASAEAVFGDYKQEFGYYVGTTSTTYHRLFKQTGYGYDVAGEADLSVLSDFNGTQTIRWARGGQSRTFSSRPSDNPDGVDHMVTYRIDGLNDGFLTWIVFWEDLLPSEHPDFDYQDEVVQLKAILDPATNAPEPATLGLLLIMAPFALVRRVSRG